MMLGISTPTYDLSGDLLLDYTAGSDIKTHSRRASKVATLDGGIEIIDSGYTDSDRTFNVEINTITDEKMSALLRLMKLYPLLNLSCNAGYFSGVISNLDANKIPVTFTVLIEKKYAS